LKRFRACHDPACFHPAAITRTDGAEISSLRLTRFDVAIRDPPKQDGRGSRLRRKQSGELCEAPNHLNLCHRACVGQGAPLDFPVAGDQEERDTLNCVLADFKAYLLIPQVRFLPKPLIFQVFRNF